MKLDAFTYLINKNKGGSSGGAELNIAYGDTPPTDTTKLWVKTAEPEVLQITPKLHPINEELDIGIGNLPTAAQAIASSVVGTKVYLFGGYGSSRLSTINVFDTESNTITTLGAKLPSYSSDMASAVVGTKVYLFGGAKGTSGSAGSNDRLATINVFNTESNTITTLSKNLPSGAYGITSAVVGTKVYLFGGYDGSFLSRINVFDTESNTITTLDVTLPVSNCDIASAVVGAKVYLFGGSSVGTKLNTINVFVALTELPANNMLIETSTTENTFDLLPNMVVGVRNVFIGNAEGYAERAEAYLHNGTEWRKL